MSVDTPKHRRRGGPAAEGSGQSLRMMARIAVGLFLLAFLFGPLPQSDAVRARLARAGLVSSGRADQQASATTTTVPPPVDDSTLDEMLASSGYPDVAAAELDRVVTLTGFVPDDASRRVIDRLVRAVPGVVDVVDHTVIATPGSTGDVTITGTTSRVDLAGAVPDQAAASALLEAVQSVYVADQITGSVTVDPEIEAPAQVTVVIESTRAELGARIRDAFDAIDPTLVQADVRFRQLEIPRLEQQLDDLLDAQPIEFAVGSSQVDEASTSTLDEVAQLLETSPTAVIEVGGHTDDSGSDRANRQLSLERARSVVAQLEDRGVTSDLRAVGYGETRPRTVPFDTDEARAANRRIEFVLIDR